MMEYLILGLPRSRTAWLSHFLSYQDWTCGHEEIRHLRSYEDIKSYLSIPQNGSAETAAAPWWRTIQRLSPGIKFIIIRRPIDEVIESLSKKVRIVDKDSLFKRLSFSEAKFEQILHRAKNAISFSYDSLSSPAVCSEIFQHCLPYSFDKTWWENLNKLNIQINLPNMIKYFDAYDSQFTRLTAQMKQRELAKISQRDFQDLSGYVISQEPFNTFMKEGKSLLNSHCTEVNEHPDNYLNKNLILFKTLDEMGHLQVLTARLNGKIFGYLITIISPSLEGDNIISAVNTVFHVSSATPGLGLKLQRAAIKKLEEKNVTEVFFRAGIRGSGEKISSIYKRLGAEFNGTMYRLSLGEK